ncbi:hypothetical protein Adt_19019 [Abeliophyllum distichum]|uniref:Uncharacterized protein n=1 Tax=Abeliophyllum distichum TaxID=126358 RepID=A0ABD1TL12_9LAMI
MIAKRSRRKRPPSSSTEEEASPKNWIDKCSILIGGEEMDEDKDVLSTRPRSHRPSSSTFDFTFTEDQFNLLNRRIDSLTSTVEGLYHIAEGLRHTMGTLQQSMDEMTSLLQKLHSRLDARILPPPPSET